MLNSSTNLSNANVSESLVPDTSDNDISPVFTGAMLVISTWIILCNGALVYCFLSNRRQLWDNSFTVHVLSLTVTDLLVGVCSIPVAMTSFPGTSLTFALCYIQVCPLFMSQTAGLLHVLGICLHRMLTVFRKQRGGNKNAGRYIIAHIVLTWGFSVFIFLILPYLYCLECPDDFSHKYCNIVNLFRDRSVRIGRIWSFCYLVPLVLVNVIYVFLCIRLAIVRPKIQPAVQNLTRTSKSDKQKSETPAAGTSNPEQPVNGNDATNVPTTSGQSLSQPSRQGNNQNRTFWTIGILLVLLDIFLVPFTVSVLIDSGQEDFRFSRETRFILLSLVIMNSAVNPAVYILRMRPLKEQLQKAATRLLNACWCSGR